MTKYIVKLSTEICVDISVEASSEEEAKKNWHKREYALMEARNEVIDEARMLDEFEFSVEDVYLEGDLS